MIVAVVNKSDNALPEYETPGSAGLDVRCTHAFAIDPGGRALVPTGLFVEIPKGYEIQVRPRSGLALKHGITVLNTPGTIDADYRGEVGVILINHGPRSVEFEKGDRIAQLVLCKVEHIEWLSTGALTGTKRGEKGFGSTGGK
jgi:dUTP pyrophosphatase